MTHEERALRICEAWFGADDPDVQKAKAGIPNLTDELIQAISRGMAEASNAELERRRIVEVERDRLSRIVAVIGEYRDSVWFREFMVHKMRWSAETFGPGQRTQGLIAHIRKELAEIEANPSDLVEWIDVVLLAMDGYTRQWMADTDLDMPGERLQWLAACDFIHMLLEKQQINEARTWPAPGPQDQPTEHIR